MTNNTRLAFTSIFLSITVNTLSFTLSADVISDTVHADIQEPADTYNNDAPTLLTLFARTVIGDGACNAETNDGCTLNDVLNDIDTTDDFQPEIRIHFSADDYADDGTESNAELRQRGNISRLAPQKSFRIKLDKETELWRGQRRIQLVKSFFELSRVRNKLSFDLFKDILHLPSMRTQFVNLFIEDQSSNEDQGLYTHIENVGKEYLVRRGWDEDSPVYKAELFFYQNSPALALDENGLPVDEAAFEEVLEIKRGENHTKLLEMVQDLNNDTLDFQTDVFNKYFNQDNYLTWLAANILVNNTDTDAHNYYLFNPKDTERFYILPWDYDFAWGSNIELPGDTVDQLPRWWFSHANWWGNHLHQQFLSAPGNLDLLKEAVEEIKDKYFSNAQIEAKRDAYYDIVFPLITRDPDFNFIELPGNTDPERIAEYNRVFDELSKNVEFNHDHFLERTDDPMPFFMSDPEFQDNNTIYFSWGESSSLSNQTVVYDLEIATTKEFKTGTIIEEITNIPTTSHTLSWSHAKGTYYFRVISRDENNPQQHWQVAFDSGLNFDNNVPIYGVKEFEVGEDGNPTPPPPADGGISNFIPDGSIRIDGNDADWNNLALFNSDGDDILNNASNVINWDQNGFAHSDDTLYVLYKNHGNANPDESTGTNLVWGWQTYLDTDNDPNTGFRVNDIGADFLLEGNTFLEYQGDGKSWDWLIIGQATSRFENSTVELSFPRSWIGGSNTFKLVFLGNNEAFGGDTTDEYPGNNGSFTYALGDGVTPPVEPPVTPPVEPPSTNTPIVPSRSGGGNIPWEILLLTSMLLLVNRRKKSCNRRLLHQTYVAGVLEVKNKSNYSA